MRNKAKGLGTAEKNKINLTKLPNDSRLCSTCAFWQGSRKIKPSGQIEVHPYSKGDCHGGGFSYAAMSALATCDQWELWAFMNLGLS